MSGATATAYSFVLPLVMAAFFAVWYVARSSLTGKEAIYRRPDAKEAFSAFTMVIFSITASYVLILRYPQLFNVTNIRGSAFPIFLASTGLLLVPSLVPALWSRTRFWIRRFGLRTAKKSLVLGGVASIVLFVPSLLVSPELLGKVYVANSLLLGAMIYSAVCEEALYRGLLQANLTRSIGVRAGIVVSAFVFDLSHLPTLLLGDSSTAAVSRFLVLSLPALLLYGYVAEKSESIWGSTLVHSVYNLPLILLD